jgi:hypothetical protein
MKPSIAMDLDFRVFGRKVKPGSLSPVVYFLKILNYKMLT